MARTARFIMSGLNGVVKMAGSVAVPVFFPWRLKMLAVFLVSIVYSLRYFPWVDSIDV